MTRPVRQNKGDRLTNPGSTPEQIACDFALAPFDNMARAMEQKWGVERLPCLVAPDMAARYGKAVAALNDAIGRNDPADTAAHASNCARGLAAMDAAATAAGHAPVPPKAIELTVGGKPCAIIADDALWPLYEVSRPGVRVYTLQEVRVALEGLGQIVCAAKDAFPGAQITAVRSPLSESLDDEIPF